MRSSQRGGTLYPSRSGWSGYRRTLAKRTLAVLLMMAMLPLFPAPLQAQTSTQAQTNTDDKVGDTSERTPYETAPTTAVPSSTTFPPTTTTAPVSDFAWDWQLSDLSFRQGVYVSEQLPTATSSSGRVTYSLTPSLPRSLSYQQPFSWYSLSSLWGMPRTVMSPTTYTWTATDSTGTQIQQTFTMEITGNQEPSYSGNIPTQVVTVGEQVNIELPAAQGGDGPLTYSLMGSLPGGLSANGRTITGVIPTVDHSSYRHSWLGTHSLLLMVRDTDYDTIWKNVYLEVRPPSGLRWGTRTSTLTYWTVGHTGSHTLRSASVDSGSLTYHQVSEPPAGLSLSGKAISGSPTTPAWCEHMDWYVEDSQGYRLYSYLYFTIYSQLNVPAIADQVFNHGVHNEVSLTEISGGRANQSYTISPALPDGLEITHNVRWRGYSWRQRTRYLDVRLSGTPTTTQAATPYTFTATDKNGATVSRTFNLSVRNNSVPSFSESSVSALSFRVGRAVDVTLPEATGGDAPLQYSLTPYVPSGLQLDGTRLHGTPLTYFHQNIYQLRVRDVDGDTASINVPIEVAENSAPWLPSSLNKNWRTGLTYDYQLPEASRGDGTISYALTPDLPAGFNLVDGSIQGTTTETGVFQFIWTATDEDGDSAQTQLTITIRGNSVPRFSDASPHELSVRAGSYVRYPLPLASGGDGGLTYTLSPQELPAVAYGIRYLVLYMLGTEEQARTEYTWTARDVDGDSATWTFYITIVPDLKPTFEGVPPIGDLVFKVGEPVSMVLPEAIGGDAPVDLHLDLEDDQSLPAGLEMVGRTLQGTPTEAMEEDSFVWLACDSDGDITTTRFTITVEENNPTYFSEQISDQVWRTDIQNSLTLPSVTGGTAPYTYSITPEPPAGVTRNGMTLSGAPTAVAAAQDYTWSVIDADGNTAETTFSWEVELNLVPGFDTYTPRSHTVRTGRYQSFELPRVHGGNGELTLSLTPTLPSVVQLQSGPQGNFVMGMWRADSETTLTYTWTATDEDGDSRSETITVTVRPDTTPELCDPNFVCVADITWRTDSPIRYQLPQATGGEGQLTYTLTPALPAGLTRVGNLISGTPTAVMADGQYTWSVLDEDGDQDQVSFNIRVTQDQLPSFSGTIPNQVWEVGESVALTLPSATGGDGPIQYSLSPILPAGVTRERRGFVVTGSPTSVVAVQEYVWKATDDDRDEAELRFTIEVNEPAPPPTTPTPTTPTTLAPPPTTQPPPPNNLPTFGEETIPNQLWGLDDPVSLTLPAATGGDGTLTYALTPNLPSGVSLTDKVISGTPDTLFAWSAFEWTVSDADGDEDTLHFWLRVGYQSESESRIWRVDDVVWVMFPDIDYNSFGLNWTWGVEAKEGSLVPDGVDSRWPMIVTGYPTDVSLNGLFAIFGNLTVWAENADGSIRYERDLLYSLQQDRFPSLGRGPGNMVWIHGEDISSGPGGYIWLPQATGGDTPYTYELDGDLPTGVSLEVVDNGNRADTYRLVGTPTEYIINEWREFTWRVWDGDNIHSRDKDELTFSIKVVADQTPRFGVSSHTSNLLTSTSLSGVTLPQAFGGNGTLTYSISPELPAGVTLNPTTGGLSGATSVPSDITYRYTVTDSDNVNPDSTSIDLRIVFAPSAWGTAAVIGSTEQAVTTETTLAQETAPNPVSEGPGPRSVPTGGGGGDENSGEEDEGGVVILVQEVSFEDGQQSSHRNSISELAVMGITQGCNPPYNTMFCPDRGVTRGEMATFLSRALNLQAASQDYFADDAGSTHEDSINRLAEAGITSGCNPPTNTVFCPDRQVTRAQMATFLARGLQLDQGDGESGFADLDGSKHSSHIRAILGAGITQGCNPPLNTRFCPDRAVTRAEMATFLVRALDLKEN